METKIYKQIELENGYTLNIFDLSRKISDDAFLVNMKAQIEIKVINKLFTDPVFSDQVSDIKLKEIQGVLGDSVAYEYVVERNFIMAEDKDTVFGSLVNTFMENLGQYVAKPQFPGKFVLKEYKEKTK